MPSSPGSGRLLEGYMDLRRRRSTEPARDSVIVHSTDPFPTIVRQWRLGPVGACLLEGGAIDVTPVRRYGDQIDPADLIVGFVVDGAMHVSQRGRGIELHEGQAVLYQVRSLAELHAPREHRYLVAQVPARVLRTSDAEQALTAQDLSGYAAGAVLAALLGSVASSLGAGLNNRMGEHVGDALVSCVRALVAETQEAPGDRSDALFDTFIRWIDGHLSAEVSADSLAAAHFVSPRYVRKVFTQHGTTVSDQVRQRRLERIRHELLDPRASTAPVSAVAARWGFTDASVFTRAFKRQYGQGPQSYRRDASRPAG
jgi:AraC-like DNA-binding protein